MKKFKDAFNGLKVCIRHKAVIIQLTLGLLAIIGGIIIGLNYYEWLIFVVCIGSVIALEIVNTCIESLCDYVCEEYNEKIKRIKDMSAAFVLIASIMSFVICLMVVIIRIVR